MSSTDEATVSNHIGDPTAGSGSDRPVAAGMDSTIAVPSVFLSRLFASRVPILPGWLSFQWLERRECI